MNEQKGVLLVMAFSLVDSRVGAVLGMVVIGENWRMRVCQLASLVG